MPQNNVRRIYNSTVKIMEPLTLEGVCERSVNEACKLFNARDGSIFWSIDGKLQRLFSTIPLKQQFDPSPRGNAFEVFTTQKPRYMSLEELKERYPKIVEEGIKSYILVPLSYAKKPLGVMSLQSDVEHTSYRANANNMKLFGTLVSLAIRNIQLFEQKQEALNQRDLFMSLASHELKTPLAVVIMTLHLIERALKSQKPLNPKWINTVKRNAQRLKLLIDDLFSVSQISAGAIQIRWSKFSIVEICERVVSELTVVHRREIKLMNKLEDSSNNFLADEEKISLVLTNIISNAIKFSSSDSKITVSLKQKGEGIEISVKDQGIGIEPEDQEKVFDRYFQGKNRHNGLGLGLFLSREIIEAHDGEIYLKSKLNEGTTVYIWLPYHYDFS